MITKYDIDLSYKPKMRGKARRTIFFGGERLRMIEIWNDQVGKPLIVRVLYSDDAKSRRHIKRETD